MADSDGDDEFEAEIAASAARAAQAMHGGQTVGREQGVTVTRDEARAKENLAKENLTESH